MNILVANLGSTSFKYKLYEMPFASVLARGSMDRIGGSLSCHIYQIGATAEIDSQRVLANHESAIDETLVQLLDHGVLHSLEELDAVGFKAVHARDISGVVALDDDVVERMVSYYPLAPAHNPTRVSAIRKFAQMAPQLPLVGCFETAFHSSAPVRRQLYAVPYDGYEKHGVRRYGFHGASHRSAAEKVMTLEGKRA